MHNIPDFLRVTPEMQEHFAHGGMIKRADGHYSRRGLWDNIRANKGSGRKPTKQMLEQEAKIRAKEQYGGRVVDEYGNGGYIVKRSNARKGKTHVVIGPDGTKKYFGDSKLGQHPNDPERKKAFYARHKHNLEHNPYFRAFARATWADGGEIPEFAYGAFYNREEANKMQNMFTPSANSMTPSFANGGLTRYQDGTTVVVDPYRTPTRTFTPPASNYPTMQMDMRGSENRWADRQPLQGMQQAPLLTGATFHPEIVETSPAPTQPVVAAPPVVQPTVQAPQQSREVERMETIPMGIKNITGTNETFRPMSLGKVKAAPVIPSYLEKTYESTEGIPKTVLQFFDTENHAYENNDGKPTLPNTRTIFDKATNKAYKREYNPETGKFKILAYPIANDPVTQRALLGDVAAYNDDYVASTLSYNTTSDGIVKDNSACMHGDCEVNQEGQVQYFTENPSGKTQPFSNAKDKYYFNPYGNFMTVDSSKSFDDNINMMKATNRKVYDAQNVQNRVNQEDYDDLKQKIKNQLKRDLTKEEDAKLKASMIARQQQIPFDPSLVRMPSHQEMEYYIPEFQDEEDPNFEENKKREINYYDKEANDAQLKEIEEQGYRNGGSIRRRRFVRRFDVGGNNPFDNQLTSQNQFNSTYSPYSTNIWDQQQQSIPAQQPISNPFDNQINNQNAITTTGTPYTTTVAQTANSGQGANSTTPQQSPAVISSNNITTNNTPTPTVPAQTPRAANASIAGGINTTQPSSVIDDKTNLAAGLKQNSAAFSGNPFIQGAIQNAQNITNSLNTPATTDDDGGAPGPVNTPSILNPATPPEQKSQFTGEQIAKMNQEYEDRMIKQYGVKRVDIDKRYEELSKQYTNSTPSDIYSAINKEFADQAKANEMNRANAAEKGRMKAIAGTLHGIDKMGQATVAGLDMFSRMNPNSYQNAVLNKNRENANPTNTMNIVGNRKGIEYSAYGGYTGLKEGLELDLSTQQIHELEKQGYKFQIL